MTDQATEKSLPMQEHSEFRFLTGIQLRIFRICIATFIDCELPIGKQRLEGVRRCRNKILLAIL